MQTSPHPQTLAGEQMPHVLFRHRKAFLFYLLVLENFGTLLGFGDLKAMKVDGLPWVHIFAERLFLHMQVSPHC